MNNKKVILLAIFLVWSIGIIKVYAADAPYPQFPFNKNLSQGLCDNDVQFLQEYLQSHAYIPTSTQLTGYFGSITLKAVKKMQMDNHINSTGFVGPLTRAFLNGEHAKYVYPQPTNGMGSGLMPTPKCIYDQIPVAPPIVQ